jgi:hypothetical protein
MLMVVLSLRLLEDGAIASGGQDDGLGLREDGSIASGGRDDSLGPLEDG